MAGNPQAASNPLSTRSAYSQVSNVDNNNGSFDWHHQAAVIICTLVVAAGKYISQLQSWRPSLTHLQLQLR